MASASHAQPFAPMEHISHQSKSTLHGDRAPRMGVFFSPPEAHQLDSFSDSQSPIQKMSRPQLQPIRAILSPPISPATKPDQEPESQLGRTPHELRDPPLFPRHPSIIPVEAAQPLFQQRDEQRAEDDKVIDQHIAARRVSGTEDTESSRDDYAAVLSFQREFAFTPKVIDKVRRDPHGYLGREMAILDQYPPRFPQKSIEKGSGTKRKADNDSQLSKRPRPFVEKLPLPKRVRKAPREDHLDFPDGVELEPVKKHKRKVSHITPISREALDYKQLPDYCPPISAMLPGTNLKTDWKGTPSDFRDDPDRDMLAPEEIPLASVLRLSCAQYLYAKRAIFQSYVHNLREGHNFNKTTCQGVCRMDVNKASRLFLVFERVGWFNKKHFLQYLH